MTELDAGTFDLFEALQGVSYPEATFPIFFDAKAAQAVTLANRELDAANPSLPEFKEKEAEFLALLGQFQGSKYEVTVRGIPHEHQQDVLDTVIKEMEGLKGTGKSQLQLQQYMETRLEQVQWGHYIVKIEDPEGRVIAPVSVEEATALHNKLPDSSRKEVERQIEKMRNDEAAGYEIGISDFDFLSVPSQGE